MFPKDGWINFHETTSLVRLIWSSLNLKDQSGLWEYHNFTSDSSYWANGNYNLSLKFSNEDCEKINSIEFNVPDNKNAELNFLIVQFHDDFGLLKKYS
ncbi:hypothetical protein Q4575_07365 [Psychrosphaera sp. 1_MG-2023]|nr:hypothetical protein [Psychrosphaera sp. 1_MG-2023]